jgi:hypothetical protein
MKCYIAFNYNPDPQMEPQLSEKAQLEEYRIQETPEELIPYSTGQAEDRMAEKPNVNNLTMSET